MRKPAVGEIVSLPEVKGFETTSRKVELAGFVLSETIHQPAQRLPQHSHECASIIHTLRGSFSETIRGRVHECGTYSLFFRPAGEVHTNQYGRVGAKSLIIGIKPPRDEISASLLKLFHQARYIQGGLLRSLAMRIYKEVHIMDSASELAIEGLTLELLANATRQIIPEPKSRLPTWLKQATGLLEAHFAERLKFSDIATSVGVHPVYLASTFHRHFQCTMGDYIRRLRVEFACRMLTTTDTPLVEIALAAGFSAQSHFSTTFKRQTGLTPSEFRVTTRSN